ncbi:hypothetical protein P5G50_17090 [Leifsonia sp. F6_8S_P_1B]|uniref:Uncharacterized protein n=1 Tax=Leifsonia williamsii TaxID=3035919 RepID=A0ABT8KFE4_9MICO|nr:hypothetical protein [Leifsonia williamsii]MDN4616166.1 hypothetical protein [Leifsonia williamsii]
MKLRNILGAATLATVLTLAAAPAAFAGGIHDSCTSTARSGSHSTCGGTTAAEDMCEISTPGTATTCPGRPTPTPKPTEPSQPCPKPTTTPKPVTTPKPTTSSKPCPKGSPTSSSYSSSNSRW